MNRVTKKEVDTSNVTQYQSRYRSGRTICAVALSKYENFFPGILKLKNTNYQTGEVFWLNH